MTVLFLVIGLEVKRELTIGRLRDPGPATLPILATMAGAAVPALVFLAFNPHSPAARGWAIPMATDPAFAVGVLALLGSRVPAGVKAFLLTLAGLGGDGALRCGDAGPPGQRGLPPMTDPAPHQPGGYRLRPATGSDVPSVAALVHAAYDHYVQRIGMLPRPMTDDYAAVIRDRQVTVAERDAAIVGVVVLTVTDEGFLVDNVAVHPSRRGTGLGRALLQFAEAEARRAGFDAIHLYTHEQMTENLALYSRIGYVEYDRRSQGAFSLVYMRKQLG